MERIKTVNREVDKFGPGKDGFRSAVPGVSEPTYLSADFFNGLQESLMRVQEEAGLPPSADFGQLYRALTIIGERLNLFKPDGSDDFSRAMQVKLREFPSVEDFQAIGDGVTINTAAFAKMEAHASPTFYVPYGHTYQSGHASLRKNYQGPGAVVLTGGMGIAGTASLAAIWKTTGQTQINAGRAVGIRSDVFIGDSNYFGAGVAQSQSWLYLLQQMVNSRFPFGQGSYQSGGNLDRLTRSGTITDGVSGPLRASLILQPGAQVSFTADYVDYLAFWFERKPSAGSIILKKGGVVLGTRFCMGTASSNAFSGIDGLIETRGGVGELYTLECVDSSVEINGIFASHSIWDAKSNPVFIQSQVRSGYSSADFVSAEVIAAIVAQTVYTNYLARVFFGPGTNDIYNPNKAISAAQYKANIAFTTGQLTARASVIILVVPLRAGNGTYKPVVEPFENYRQAIYEVAREFNYDVLDLSEIDLIARGGYQPDMLHADASGHGAIAAHVFNKYYADMVVDTRRIGITLLNGAGNADTIYGPPLIEMHVGGVCQVEGWIMVAGIPKGTYIGKLPSQFAPLTRKSIAGVTVGNTGLATLLVEPDGRIMLFDYTAASITYVSLDGQSYSCK
jgi:lysophospholipase L1-like esterase